MTAKSRFAPFVDNDRTPHVDQAIASADKDRRTWYDEPEDILSVRRNLSVNIRRRKRCQRIADVAPWLARASR
jgi:hypothetical protein